MFTLYTEKKSALLLGVGQYVGLEVGGLGKLLGALVEGAGEGSISGVHSDVCAQVEV